MKALLSKEFKLCVHPALFIYLALILMLLGLKGGTQA